MDAPLGPATIVGCVVRLTTKVILLFIRVRRKGVCFSHLPLYLFGKFLFKLVFAYYCLSGSVVTKLHNALDNFRCITPYHLSAYLDSLFNISEIRLMRQRTYTLGGVHSVCLWDLTAYYVPCCLS